MKVPFFSAGDGSFSIIPHGNTVRVKIGKQEAIAPLEKAEAACEGLPELGMRDRIATAYAIAQAIFNAA